MKIDESLSKEIESARRHGHSVPVIITMRDSKDVALLAAKGIKPTITYASMPAVAAEVTAEQVEQMRAMPEIELVEFDSEAHALRKQ